MQYGDSAEIKIIVHFWLAIWYNSVAGRFLAKAYILIWNRTFVLFKKLSMQKIGLSLYLERIGGI